jgi:DNA processing protein
MLSQTAYKPMETGHSDAHLLALANCPVFGSRTLEKLFERFENSEAAWNATTEELLALGVTEKRADFFKTYRAGTSPEAVLNLCRENNVQIITKDHPHYPPLLKTIFDPPYLLFALGDTSKLLKTSVAMVGSRLATSYGREVALQFSRDLSNAGIVVVSGLAHGIDSVAHEGALHNGHTVAVLGNGILFRMTREQEDLKKRILEKGGVVMSEFSLRGPGHSYNFPIRNRIVAGMSAASVIIEAKLPSGSLITAKVSLENGRDVFAVPGPITSMLSSGTNDLLKDGAHVATSAADILFLLGEGGQTSQSSEKSHAYTPKDEYENAIIELLKTKQAHIDEIIKETALSPAKASETLMNLEINAVVTNTGGMRYKLGR